jgi:hypothetical protein
MLDNTLPPFSKSHHLDRCGCVDQNVESGCIDSSNRRSCLPSIRKASRSRQRKEGTPQLGGCHILFILADGVIYEQALCAIVCVDRELGYWSVERIKCRLVGR